MYHKLKSIIRNLFPIKLLFKVEPMVRYFYALPLRGTNHQCSVCNVKLKKFITLENCDLLCPNCGSLARDRRLYTVLQEGFLDKSIRVLDFSPSRCLSRKLKKNPKIDYKSTDLSGNFNADFHYDITNLPLEANSLDLIICYHVLEHIDSDLKAMEELFRVLKSGGKAIIQTPFKEGTTYENAAIQSPEDRLLHFGQDDHVRIYSVSGLQERLSATGFKIEIKQFPEKDLYLGLTENETLFIITKP